MNLILDVDGTLADASHRSHFVDGEVKDWDSFLQPHLVIQDTVIEGARRGYDYLTKLTDSVFFLTGRNESLRDATAQWLKTHFDVNCNAYNLIMRPIDDNSVPSVFKENALLETIENRIFLNGNNQSAIMAIDDDPYMMRIYRDLGYIALHAPECWKTMFPDFDHLTDETTWRR